MHIKPKHIALFGNFGSDNLGNEASLKAMIDFLRRERPDAELTCVCYGVESAQSAFGLATLPITPSFPRDRWFKTLNRWLLKIPFQLRDFFHALRHVRKFDVLIVPGTGILDDFSERWQGMPYDLFKWGIAAIVMRRPFAFVSVGAGPIHHWLSRWLMKSAARLARYRSFRDELSKDYMVALGAAKESDPIFPDLVFSLPTPEQPARKTPGDGITTIGVGVMHYYGWDRHSPARPQIHETYIASMSQFICWLLEHGYHIRLLLGAQSDRKSYPEILARVTAKCGAAAAQAMLAEPAASFDALMRQIAETDLVVTTRFHNIVAALKLGRPAISLGYARKNDVLLEKFGLGSYCQPVEHIDVPTLISQFESLVQTAGLYPARLEETAEDFRRCLEEQNAFLLENLL